MDWKSNGQKKPKEKMRSPDDIDRFAFDPSQTIALNPNVTISNQLCLGQSNPRIFLENSIARNGK